MNHDYPGVYLRKSANTYESTPLANAGWYDEGQHGGPVSALIADHVDKTVPTLAPMQISRVTVEIFRVIPLTTLRIETSVVREGKRIQSVAAALHGPDGTMLGSATVQRLRTADLPAPEDAAVPAAGLGEPEDVSPVDPATWGVGQSGKTMFHRHAMEVREVYGGFGSKGPGGVWMRLKTPIVADEEITPLQRVVATADFCNGVSRALDLDKWVFMNPDLTVHVARYPQGDWVGLAAESGYADNGRGVATGSLWDNSGWLGRSTQSLYLDLTGQ